MGFAGEQKDRPCLVSLSPPREPQPPSGNLITLPLGQTGELFAIAIIMNTWTSQLSAATLFAAVALDPSPAFSQPGTPELPDVPPGLKVEMYAKEPLIRNPAATAFDARGRLFVGQGPQYRSPRGRDGRLTTCRTGG